VKPSRAEVEALLESMLGAPASDPDDLRVEIRLLAAQSAVLAVIATPGPRTLGPEEVELALDAIEDFGDCEIADLAGVDWSATEVAAPAMEVAALRELIARAARREGRTAACLLHRVATGIAATRDRLQAVAVLLERARPKPEPS
jgi:hypothetical protein